MVMVVIFFIKNTLCVRISYIFLSLKQIGQSARLLQDRKFGRNAYGICLWSGLGENDEALMLGKLTEEGMEDQF